MRHETSWQELMRSRRKALGLTQAQLASELDYSAVMINQVERGITRPSEALVKRLAESLGLNEQETLAFVRAARRKDPPDKPGQALLIAPPGGRLNPQKLIGRSKEITSVRHLLLRDRHQLVMITGLPGVGKSSLAAAVADSLKAEYPDGVFWVSLAPFHDALVALNAVAHAAGIAGNSGQSLPELIRSTLAGRRMLILLDNCEQIDDMALLIDTLITGTAIQVLATSRKRALVNNEQQLILAPLALPTRQKPVDLSKLRKNPAFALFVRRAQETAPDFAPDSDNAALISQICLALDGIPLAIELVAVWVCSLDLAAILAVIQRHQTWPFAGRTDLPDRQRTLDNTLGWSYGLLDSRQQELFRALSVFGGTFSLSGVAAVWGAADEAEVLAQLMRLTEWHLLNRVSGTTPEPRFSMRVIIREFALKRLGEYSDKELLRQRQLGFYLNLAQQDSQAGKSRAASVETSKLEAEQDNFRAVLDWALTEGNNIAGAAYLALAIRQFWETRGYWQEAQHWLEELLLHADQLEPLTKGRLLFGVGRFAYLHGNYTQAIKLLSECRIISQAQEDADTEIQALNSLGWVAYSQSSYRQAQVFYAQALAICHRRNDQPGIANALNTLGAIAVELGEPQAAVKLLAESLKLRQAHDDKLGTARSLNVLGLAALHLDDLDAAQSYLQRSIDLFRLVGDRLGVALATNNLGWSYFAAGNIAKAKQVLDQAFALAQELGSVWCMTLVTCYLGWVNLVRHERAQAKRQLQESLAQSTIQGINLVIILSRIGLARIALEEKDQARASANYLAAETLRSEIGIGLLPLERLMITQIKSALT